MVSARWNSDEAYRALLSLGHERRDQLCFYMDDATLLEVRAEAERHISDRAPLDIRTNKIFDLPVYPVLKDGEGWRVVRVGVEF